MGKYKAAKKKAENATPQVKPGLPCLVLVVGAVLLVAVVMILVVRSAG